MLSEKVSRAVIVGLLVAGFLLMVVFEVANPPVDWLNVLFGAAFLPIVVIGSYSWLKGIGRLLP